MGSTSDKISGKANELAGKAKQAIGDATDNHSLEAKGAAQEAKGHGQHIGITQGLANVALTLHFAHAQGKAADAVGALRYF